MKTTPEQNKKLVLQAFDMLFNKRDYEAAKHYWSPNYIQHSAHIEPSRDGLFNLIRSAPPTLNYEPGLIVAEGDYVIVHWRFSGRGSPVNWIAADIVRIENGVLQEHWDVLQDEVTRSDRSGLPRWTRLNRSTHVQLWRDRRTTTIPGLSKRHGSTSAISTGWRKHENRSRALRQVARDVSEPGQPRVGTVEFGSRRQVVNRVVLRENGDHRG